MARVQRGGWGFRSRWENWLLYCPQVLASESDCHQKRLSPQDHFFADFTDA